MIDLRSLFIFETKKGALRAIFKIPIYIYIPVYNSNVYNGDIAAAATLKFFGNNSMSLRYEKSVVNEANDLVFRFRTKNANGLLMSTRHDRSQDKLEITLEAGRIRIQLQIGQTDKNVYAGHSLNDDMYHTMSMKRRGTKLQVYVDDDEPVLGEAIKILTG